MIKDKQKHFKRSYNKLFLPSGLLSLGTLPLIFLVFFYRSAGRLSERLLPIIVFELKHPDAYEASFSHYVLHKQYTHFNLTCNDQVNREIFNAASKEINKMVKAGDTLNGVHFYIPDNAEFHTFIEAIDLCKQLKAEVYIPDENDLWIVNALPLEKEDSNEIMFTCPSGSYTKLPNVSIIQNEILRKQKEQFYSIVETVWTFKFPMLLFAIMVILNIRKIRLFNKSMSRNTQTI